MTEAAHAERKPWLSDRAYSEVKFFTTIILPALGTLYFALAEIWNLPNPEAVVGTIVAVVTFMGIFLNRAEAQYNTVDPTFDGTLDVIRGEDDKKIFFLNLDGDPEHLEGKESISFKINPS